MGQNCDINIDDCTENSCLNGGTCHDLVGTFQCSCPPGTQGTFCQLNNEDCYENACHHGGRCIDRVNGFDCECVPGYVGHRCEGDINECLSKPCHPVNSLSCKQGVNEYTCDCKPGFAGKYSYHSSLSLYFIFSFSSLVLFCFILSLHLFNLSPFFISLSPHLFYLSFYLSPFVLSLSLHVCHLSLSVSIVNKITHVGYLQSDFRMFINTDKIVTIVCQVFV